VKASKVRLFPAKPPQSPPQRPATPQTPATPSTPQRTETITYDAWQVTCRDPVTAGGKKICSGILSLQVVQDGRRQVLGAWVIGKSEEGVLTSVLQTPQVQIGILIQKGVDLKLGSAAPRKLNYVVCSAQRCEASIPMDAAMVRDSLAAADATIVIHTADGKDITLNIPSIKGIDKAIAAIGR
jgi:invasion protein IalB